jgi:membrane fusion protein, multidrug efflux system
MAMSFDRPSIHFPTRQGRWTTVASALCLLLALGAAAGCGGDADSAAGPAGRSAPAPVPVRVANAVTADVPVEIKVIGNVEPLSTVTIRSQVEGQLAEVHFREGQEVSKGDLLFTVDPRPFEAALRQAEANLARDLAQAKNAETEAERRRKLFKQGFISSDENDQAQTRAAVAGATTKADLAAVENAKLQQQYCYIRSPLSGRIGQILAHEGNVVKANDTQLAVINQIRPIEVAFSVPEQDLARIRAHAASGELAVEATAPGSETKENGRLTFIDNAVDTKTGTVLLKGRFDNQRETLWPGQFVDVALTLGVDRNVITVPAEAIQTGQEGAYVFVVKPDLTVAVRPVQVGRTAGSSVIVEKGLAAGDRVVTDGQIRLADGLKVEIRDAGTAAES